MISQEVANELDFQTRSPVARPDAPSRGETIEAGGEESEARQARAPEDRAPIERGRAVEMPAREGTDFPESGAK